MTRLPCRNLVPRRLFSRSVSGRKRKQGRIRKQIRGCAYAMFARQPRRATGGRRGSVPRLRRSPRKAWPRAHSTRPPAVTGEGGRGRAEVGALRLTPRLHLHTLLVANSPAPSAHQTRTELILPFICARPSPPPTKVPLSPHLLSVRARGSSSFLDCDVVQLDFHRGPPRRIPSYPCG